MLLSIVAEPEVARWWGRFDEAQLRKRIGGEDAGAWTVELGGETIGLVIATEEGDPGQRHVELDIFLSSARHGRGLGANALGTVLRHMFEDRGHHGATLYADRRTDAPSLAAPASGSSASDPATGRSRGRWTRRDELVMDLLAPGLRLA